MSSPPIPSLGAPTSSSIPSLPLSAVSQLESLRFKSTQIIESIISLQRLIEAGGQNALPTWPDILAKYTLLLSQTHTFSSGLLRSGPNNAGTSAGGANSAKNAAPSTANAQLSKNPLAKLALHPSIALQETQLDNDLIPLLRNQQTTQVLRLESDTVRRLSSYLNPSSSSSANATSTAPTTSSTNNSNPEAILTLLDQIKQEHDTRCNRALRAVSLLRDKYDWKARVEVEAEEQEEPEFAVPISPLVASATGVGGGLMRSGSPGLGGTGGTAVSPMSRLTPLPPLAVPNPRRNDNDEGGKGDADVEMPDYNDEDDASMNTPDNEDEDEEDDDEELEEVLGPSMNADTPMPTTPLLLDEVGGAGATNR